MNGQTKIYVTPLRSSVNLTVGVDYEAYVKDDQVYMVLVGGRYMPLMRRYFH